MPRQPGIEGASDFRKGLVTEANAFNFPQNAVTDTDNCVFNLDGSVSRRLGIDFELGGVSRNVNTTNSAIATHLWNNVAGNSDISLAVVQVGGLLYFWDYKAGGNAASLGAIVGTVTLTKIPKAPAVRFAPCQFTTGNGHLFVTHPYINPLRVSFNVSRRTLSSEAISLSIRDFEGDTADTFATQVRPKANFNSLSRAHRYNLLNQGWTKANLNIFYKKTRHSPSNADVMQMFKSIDVRTAGSVKRSTGSNYEIFDPTRTLPFRGGSPAPKGHYILSPYTYNREAASHIRGVTSGPVTFQRPATCCFFAGRMFYSGIDAPKLNSNVYFSQIIESDDQYGRCYQVNDPTSEDQFDLLPSDGGVITIPEAGTIRKIMNIPGGLGVFADRGVWFITGSTGLGFTANDYAVIKISSVQTQSGVSFVDVGGAVMWWAGEGIHVLSSPAASAQPQVRNISLPSIKKFFDAIPYKERINARGFYNHVTGIVQWVYRDTDADNVGQAHWFTKILNYDVNLDCFYPWSLSVSATGPRVQGIILLDGATSAIQEENVTTTTGKPVTSSEGVVTAFASVNASLAPRFKYIAVEITGGLDKLYFAEAFDNTYLDWVTSENVADTSYNSYFITGYRLDGKAITDWQNSFLRVFSKNSKPSSFTIRGVWDFANTANTSRWSIPQTLTYDEPNYDYISSRVKIRGHGLSLQFKIDSVESKPFNIIGWSGFNMVNSQP